MKTLPRIISEKAFNGNSYCVEKTKSSLELNIELKRKIQEHWKAYVGEAKDRGLSVWDGTYYRLENIDQIVEGSDILQLSTIKYSQIKGLVHCNNLLIKTCKEEPNHVSVASVMQTSDGYFLFGRRNKKSMSKFSIDLIGGGLQPDEINIQNGPDIFISLQKEIKEETGLIEKNISEMCGIGIILSSSFNVIFIFYTLLNVTKNHVKNVFEENSDEEMSQLVFIKKDELEDFLFNSGSYRTLVFDLFKKNSK